MQCDSMMVCTRHTRTFATNSSCVYAEKDVKKSAHPTEQVLQGSSDVPLPPVDPALEPQSEAELEPELEPESALEPPESISSSSILDLPLTVEYGDIS